MVSLSVKDVQEALNRAGYATPVTGRIADSTRAIEEFQRDAGLPVTGRADLATQTALTSGALRALEREAVGLPARRSAVAPGHFLALGVGALLLLMIVMRRM